MRLIGLLDREVSYDYAKLQKRKGDDELLAKNQFDKKLDGELRHALIRKEERGELSDKLATLLRQGVKRSGSFQWQNVLVGIEEEMTGDEYDQSKAFLQWLVKNKRTFGWNIKEVYAEFTSGTKS